MRKFSTPESSNDLKITKLAIIETIFSVSILLYISIKYGSFHYLIILIIYAPFTLFRSVDSINWTFKVHNKIGKYGSDYLDIIVYKFRKKGVLTLFSLFIILYFIFYAIIGIILRTTSIIYFLIKKPIITIISMPTNWLRQCLCTDLMYPPEILPSESIVEDKKYLITFHDWIVGVNHLKPRAKKVAIVLLFPFYTIAWIPPIFYRISFKATSIIYLPFIWAINLTLKNPLPFKNRLERITKGELEKVRRYYSLFIVILLLTKLGFIFGYINYDYLLNHYLSQKIINTVFLPNSWPPWQITLGIEAILTFILLFFADYMISRFENNLIKNENKILTVVSSITFIRALVGIFTIIYLFSYVLKIFIKM